MLETEASKQSLGKQVFWLTAPSGPESPSHMGHHKRDLCSGIVEFGSLADYSGGPAPELHRFPFSFPDL
jgi:hypothetical protein